MKTKTWHLCSNGNKWRPYMAFLCSLCRTCDDHADVEFPEDIDPNKSRSENKSATVSPGRAAESYKLSGGVRFPGGRPEQEEEDMSEEKRPLEKGWDICYSDPGRYEELDCLVCGEKMEVTRDVEGPTSSVEAMAGGKHLHDQFICPHAQEDWHVQVREIRKEIKKTPSRTIELMLREECGTILATKRATKEIDEYL